MNKSKQLIVVVGPTAVGKTAMAIEIAKHFSTEIISADSRQFYKEISIGTAKPTQEELTSVKHHFIDNLSIQQEYTAGKYENEAIDLIEKLFLTHDKLVVVGGSGLYINALCFGIDDIPSDEKIKKQLIEEEKKIGLASLLQELKEKDEIYYNQVDKSNTSRIIRALEVIRVSGKAFSNFRNNEAKKRSFDIQFIGLNTDRQLLYERINKRVDVMLKNGLLDEVKSVYKYKHQNALLTVGYSELFDYLDNKIDFNRAVELIKQNTRRYAKRQLTWFRKNENIQWFKPTDLEKIISHIEK